MFRSPPAGREGRPAGTPRAGLPAGGRGRRWWPGLVLLLVPLGLLAAWLVARAPGRDAAPAARPTWRQPDGLSAWMRVEFELRRLPPLDVRARVERQAGRSWRIVTVVHPAGASIEAAVQAMAEVLVAARRRGEDQATDLGVVVLAGASGHVPVWVREASALAEDPAALRHHVAAWWSEAAGEDSTSRRGSDAPAPEASPPAGADPERPRTLVPTPLPPELVPGLPVAPVPAPGADALEAPAGAPVAGQAGLAPVAGPVPPVRVLRGPGPPLPSQASAGDSDVVVLRIQLHPGGRRSLLLRSLTIRSQGTGREVDDVAFAQLVRDVDRDGRRSAADQVVGAPVSFSDADGLLAFTGLDLGFGADGVPVYLLVLFDFEPAAQAGSFQVSVPDAASITVEELRGGALVPIVGAPLHGTLLTIPGPAAPPAGRDGAPVGGD